MSNQSIYSAPFDNVSITAACDFFVGVPADDKPATLYAMVLGQSTEFGDAQEEDWRIGLYRGMTAGSGGTAATEISYGHSALTAAATAITTMNTTAGSGGTLIEAFTWNIRVPLLWCPIPELRPTISQGDTNFGFRLLSTPADSVTLSGTLWWGEL